MRICAIVRTDQCRVQWICQIKDVETARKGARANRIGVAGLFIDHYVVRITKPSVITIRLDLCYFIQRKR